MIINIEDKLESTAAKIRLVENKRGIASRFELILI